MKLYEFTYTRVKDTPLTQEERDEAIVEFLKWEALYQGWLPGYQHQLISTTEDGDFIKYLYEVKGDYDD